MVMSLASSLVAYAGVNPGEDAKTEWPTSEVSREFAPEIPPRRRFEP